VNRGLFRAVTAGSERRANAGSNLGAIGKNISFIESVATTVTNSATDQPIQMSSAVQGFFNTLGAVTFSDQFFEKDYTFVQKDSTAILVAIEDAAIRQRLTVGLPVALGGTCSNCLARFVDAKVRSRGVLLMNSVEGAVLLARDCLQRISSAPTPCEES
jgi:hypothetical protein